MINRLSVLVWLPLLLLPLFSPFLEWIDSSSHFFPGHILDRQRVLEFYAVGTCAIGLAAVPITGRIRSFAEVSWQAYSWLAFFAWGLVSCLLAETSRRMAALEWTWFLLLVLVTYGLGRFAITDELKRLVCLITFLCPVSYVTMFFLLNGDYYFDPIIPIDLQAELFGFSNVRYFTDYQTGLLFLAPVALASFPMGRGVRILGHVLIALFFSLSFVAGSRSVFFAHGAIHLIAFVLLGRHYVSYFRSQMIYWVAGWSLYILLFNWIPMATKLVLITNDLQSRIIRLDSSLRSTLWSWSWDMISTHPWFGIGPMNFAGFANFIAAHPHNLPLQILAEWGLVPGIFGLAAVARLVVGHARALRSEIVTDSAPVATLSTAAFFSAWAILLQSLVTGATGYPVSQVELVTSIALAAGLRPHVSKVDIQSSTGVVNIAYAALTLISLGIAWLIFIPQIKTVAERNSCYQSQPWPSKHYAPRFWHQGWIVGPCRVE